ncbi:hypothetical protein [Paenibacillus terrigena]|uniref:hypothetical protein n=1 Tax=Paenibacillus terrigena TaxID=369333 RepID=UPI0012EBBD50|nr:hypothetical protein [Paenibacillus terrigena]
MQDNLLGTSNYQLVLSFFLGGFILYEIRTYLSEDIQQVLKLSKQWATEEVTIGYENVNHTEESLINALNDYFLVVGRGIVGYSFGTVKKGNAEPVISRGDNYLEIIRSIHTCRS